MSCFVRQYLIITYMCSIFVFVISVMLCVRLISVCRTCAIINGMVVIWCQHFIYDSLYVLSMIHYMFYLWLTICFIYDSLYVLSMIHYMFYLLLTICFIYDSLYVLSMTHYMFYLWFTICFIYDSLHVLSMTHYMFYLWLTICFIYDSLYVLSVLLDKTWCSSTVWERWKWSTT